MDKHALYSTQVNSECPTVQVCKETQSQTCMKKHVYSILAKVYKRKKESKTNHRNPYLT